MSYHHHHSNVPGFHPAFGFLISVILMIFGTSINHFDFILQIHLPAIVLEILQAFAFIGTGAIGTIATYKFYCENIKPIFKRKKNKPRKPQKK